MSKKKHRNKDQTKSLDDYIDELDNIYKKYHKSDRYYIVFNEKIKEKLHVINSNKKKKDLLRIYRLKVKNDNKFKVVTAGLSAVGTSWAAYTFISEISIASIWSVYIWYLLSIILLLAFIILLVVILRPNRKLEFNQLVVSLLEEELNK